MSPFERFIEDCTLIREGSPVIHNITNYVAMAPTANSLLAIGASPLMSSEPEEMEEVVALSSALVINLGCLESRQIEAMRIAAHTASVLGRPWTLDPVGAGASSLRTRTALELLRDGRPSVIRGNASEIISLATALAPDLFPSTSGPKGVDSADGSLQAVPCGRYLADKYGIVVSISGETDYITDGEEVVSIRNGSPLMPMVTAMGCTASAITSAFLAVDGDALGAASCAMALMGVTGELAAREAAGPASLQIRFLDILASLNPSEAFEMIRI